MSDIDLAELKQAADMANAEPRTIHAEHVKGIWLNSAHYLTLPPATLLALVERVERAEAAVLEMTANLLAAASSPRPELTEAEADKVSAIECEHIWTLMSRYIGEPDPRSICILCGKFEQEASA